MDIPVLDIPEAEAIAKLAEYEQSLKRDRNAEDEAIAAGYRAARRGYQVIMLPQVIEAGGYFPDGLPRLAVVRANATRCYARWDGDENIIYYDDELYDDWLRQNRGALVNRVSVRVRVGNKPNSSVPYHKRRFGGTTIVPSIPPSIRPSRWRLSRCHILWEVEKWDRTPPRDPALIRHIRGSLWAVLAAWDLTDLERAVLSQR